MDKKSQIKVVAADFTIIRSEDHPSPRIKYISKTRHEWTTLEKFETKKARDERMVKLLSHALVILD